MTLIFNDHVRVSDRPRKKGNGFMAHMQNRARDSYVFLQKTFPVGPRWPETAFFVQGFWRDTPEEGEEFLIAPVIEAGTAKELSHPE